MASLCFKRVIELGTPPESLWPILANTDRVNRALKLPPVSYGLPDASLTRLARAKLFGFLPLSWDEPPFEWVEGQFYCVHRRFHGGLIAEARVGVHFLPGSRNGKTSLEIFADVEPRGWLGRFAAKGLVGGRSLASMEKLCRSFEAALKERQDAFPRTQPVGLRERELEHRLKGLERKADPGIVDRLSRHIREEGDAELVRMRPFPLADHWGFERVEVLKGFLHACSAGVLDLSWEVLCPNCRVSKGSYTSLSHLRHQAHCETCEIVFDAEFDRNVEARFTVNAAIRPTQQAIFCLGGPANTPHRSAQILLPPGGDRPLTLKLPHKYFKLRSLRGSKSLRLMPQAKAPNGPIQVSFENAEPLKRELAFSPGQLELRLVNSSSSPLWVALDEEAWSEQGATAALVTTLSEFRDLFSSEAVSPGEEVSIRSLAILFTDLKDSTALYEKIGSAAAYALVRDHFGILKKAAAAHQGSVIKTIGDAVMAVFVSAEEALRAALAMHEGLAAYNHSRPGKEPITLKIGIHSGPVIAINADGSLDYFGTAVNVAARVQAQSVGADVVLSDAVYSSEGTQALLQERGLTPEPFTIQLKGLSDQFRLWRVQAKK